MQEKWMIAAKKADFAGLGAALGLDPVLVRVMRNRGLKTREEMEHYLYADRTHLHDPHLLKDADEAAFLIEEALAAGAPIRIIGDYDADGIQSTYILLSALRRLGAEVDAVIPDRILDGYGLNEALVTKAADEGVELLLTCDNGIAAASQIALAKSLGMTVVVTDHHEVPFEENNGARRELLPPADAIVNPKQAACTYPFKGLCGAAVAYKLVQILYENAGLPATEADEFLENAGFATVTDVMELLGENRILGKLALQRLARTNILGMRALMLQKKVDPAALKCYHIGFVLGPCINASGRLETARLSLELLLCQEEERAAVLAAEIIELNESRKLLTEHAVAEATRLLQSEPYGKEKVLVVYLPDCHESLAGIVAGRLRESFHRPVFVVTKGEEGLKGSGRSVEAYSMYEEMTKIKERFSKFGGHPMAAGFSLKEADVDGFRRALNDVCTLTEEDLQPRITIDVPMPISYASEALIHQLELLEPFGKGNEKPFYADRELSILSLKQLGKSGRVLRLGLQDKAGNRMEGVYFGDPEKLRLSLEQKYGMVVASDVLAGRCAHRVALDMTYYPQIDTFYKTPRLQIRISGFRG